MKSLLWHDIFEWFLFVAMFSKIRKSRVLAKMKSFTVDAFPGRASSFTIVPHLPVYICSNDRQDGRQCAHPVLPFGGYLRPVRVPLRPPGDDRAGQRAHVLPLPRCGQLPRLLFYPSRVVSESLQLGAVRLLKVGDSAQLMSISEGLWEPINARKHL